MRKQPLLVAALLGVVILGTLYVLRADAGRAQTPTSGIQGPYSGALAPPTRVDLRAVQPGRPGGNHVRFLGRAEAGSAASLPLAPSAPSAPSAAVAAAAPATLANFDGIGNGVAGFTVRYAPPDANAAVGPNHVVEVVNTSYAIYSKAGALLAGPTPTSTLWAGFGGPCETDNDGDGSAVYDQIADRWVIMQFAITTLPFELCVAVSQTADPAGPYFRYAFGSTNFPDYPKLAVWPDGYYVTTNDFNPAGTMFLGASIHVLDRAKMLAGLPSTQQVLGTGPNFGGLLASTLDGGTLPPAGVPSTILALDMANRGLAYWKLRVDWANPSLTTLTGPITLPAAPFTLPCGDTGGACVPQAGTRQRLDTLGDRLMYRLAYRNFGDHESLVVNHSVEVTSGNPAVTRDGIRWYELRIDASRKPSIFQQGTYAPDASYRWMGSVAMDAAGGIGLGFSLSSSVRHPEIHVTGRVAGDPAGQMPQGETTIIAGAGSQTVKLNRWGDYSSMAVDPADGCTFWYTQEYIPANGTFNWRTRIGSFRLPSCGAAPTPTSTATPTPTATNTATPTPTATSTPTPTNTPVPPTSTPTNTPTPTDTPTSTPTPTSTSTNTPSSTPTPTDTPTDTDTPTPIPTNTLVPPTATPTQSVASVGGIAEEVDPATLPSATSAASGSDRNVYGFAGVVGVLAVAAAGGWATWRRRRGS